jgi:hypothetical protein
MAEGSPTLTRLINQSKRGKKPYNKLDAFKFTIEDDEDTDETPEITPLEMEDDSNIREYAISESPPDKVGKYNSLQCSTITVPSCISHLRTAWIRISSTLYQLRNRSRLL